MLAGAALGYFVSNIWNTESVSDEESEINSLENMIKKSDTKLTELNQKQDIVEKQNKAVREMILLQGTIVSQQIDSIQHTIFAILHLTVLVSDVVSRMHTVFISFRSRQPDLLALSGLLETEMFDQIIPTSIELNSSTFQAIDHPSIRASFRAWKAVPYTNIFRILGFTHWGNLLDRPTLYEYDGAKFVMFNSSNQCVKPIEPPIAVTFVSEHCQATNVTETTLNQWKTISTGKPNEIPLKSEYKVSKLFSIIYCYPHNITVEDQDTEACPPYVFHVNSTQKWYTSDGKKYVPNATQSLNITNSLSMVKINNTVYKKENHFFNGNHAINKFEQQKKNLTSLSMSFDRKMTQVKEKNQVELETYKKHSGLSFAGYKV